MPTLILGGTTEARTLATALTGRPVITSLAGRTSTPLLPPGEVRIGGFGGATGLATYLRTNRIDALIDATHPFAATISANAAQAAAATGVPLLVLRRPGFTVSEGDDWRRVPTLEQAAALLPHVGRRVFLTTGRQGLAAFAALDECWFLVRSVEPPSPPTPRHLSVLLARGPFHPDDELRLLRTHHIDVLVTKDSGGSTAKLTAARKHGIPVVMIDRPPIAAPLSAATPPSAAIPPGPPLTQMATLTPISPISPIPPVPSITPITSIPPIASGALAASSSSAAPTVSVASVASVSEAVAWLDAVKKAEWSQ